MHDKTRGGHLDKGGESIFTYRMTIEPRLFQRDSIVEQSENDY